MKIRSYKFNWICSDAHFLNFCSTGAAAGTISFNEYCFRFGRRYQIEHNRRVRERRFGLGASMASGCLSVPCSAPTLLGSHRVDPDSRFHFQQTDFHGEREASEGHFCWWTLLLLSKLWDQAMIAVISSGKNPTMRQTERSHGISITWTHETFLLSYIIMIYEITSKMATDIHTKVTKSFRDPKIDLLFRRERNWRKKERLSGGILRAGYRPVRVKVE